MTVYLDTSVAVALLVGEAGADRVEAVLRETSEDLSISDWVNAEVASALSVKQRASALTGAERAEAAAVWWRWREGLALLPVARADFEEAERMAGQPGLSLRAADALHIAVARSAGCRLATLDRTMAAAAVALGVPVLPLEP